MAMRSPGLHPEAESNLNKLGSNEFRIADNLSRVWFVSSVRHEASRAGSYTSLLLSPSEDLYHRFNFTGELACIFCPYDHFDGRAINIADELLRRHPNRLDQNHVLFVARDHDVVRKARDLSQKDAQQRVFIPFSYQELLADADATKQITLQRLGELLYHRDLFAYDSPLRRDEDLYGREQDIQVLHGKYTNGENGCLFGLRRIGKTSVLLALERRVKKNGGIAAVIDCSSPAIHQQRWHELLRELVKRLITSLPRSHPDLARASDYTADKAASSFARDLITISAAHGKRRILLILDEIESITFDLSASTHWANGSDYLLFWQTLRSTYQNNAALLSVVVAGVNPRLIETALLPAKHDNPIFGAFTPYYLSFFDAKTVAEMLSGIGRYVGLSFEMEVVTRLTQEYGGHPFLIRQICSRVHEKVARDGKQRPFTVTRFYYGSHEALVAAAVQPYLESVIQVLRSKYPEELELLAYLAAGDLATFSSFAAESSTWVSHLTGYGLIVYEAGRYHFRIDAVKQALQDTARKSKLPTTLEEKWAVLSERRNGFESWLRRLVLENVKRKHGPKANEFMISVVKKASQRANFGSLRFQEASNKELYLLDLMDCVLKEWPEYQNVFRNDKARFELFMKEVNAARADSHARPITNEEYDVALAALNWFDRVRSEFEGH